MSSNDTGSSSGETRRDDTDVVIVGGGAAGLTAALVLGRARHRVTLIEDNTYRNATVDEFHGFPTRDATGPGRLRADALRELHPYNVTVATATVATAHSTDRAVNVELTDGTTITTSMILLATGVSDDLPPINGLAERWGKSAFNCPFCDGWEHRDQPVVVIDAAPGADHLATMLRSWTSRVTVVAADSVAELVGGGSTLTHVVLRDGTSLAANAAFVKAPVTPRNALAHQLGCTLDPSGYIVTDEDGATSNPLVWAAGDVRRPPPRPHQVVAAAADGSTAAIAIHKAFVAVRPPQGDGGTTFASIHAQFGQGALTGR